MSIDTPTGELLDARSAARMLGISRTRLYQLVERWPDFPLPAAAGAGRLWQREAIEEWAIKHPRPPRPQSSRLLEEELQHLPRGKPRSPQSLLRSMYTFARLASFKRGDSAEHALQEALLRVAAVYPGAALEYDEAFFSKTGVNVGLRQDHLSTGD